MALVGRTERRDIPGEDGEWMEFRKLTGGALDGAAGRAPGAAYDKDTLVQYGVVAWSYDAVCEDDAKKRLEAATRDWAASVVAEMNVRPPVSASGSNGSSPPDESAPNSESPTASTPAE